MALKLNLSPLTPAVHEEPLSAVAFAVVRAYEMSRQIRSVEADNDAFVALARFDTTDERTVVEAKPCE